MVLLTISLDPYVCGGLIITTKEEETLGPCCGPLPLDQPITICLSPSPLLVNRKSVPTFALPKSFHFWLRLSISSVRGRHSRGKSTMMQWFGIYPIRSRLPLQSRFMPNESTSLKLEDRFRFRLGTYNSFMKDPRILVYHDENLASKE